MGLSPIYAHPVGTAVAKATVPTDTLTLRGIFINTAVWNLKQTSVDPMTFGKNTHTLSVLCGPDS